MYCIDIHNSLLFQVISSDLPNFIWWFLHVLGRALFPLRPKTTAKRFFDVAIFLNIFGKTEFFKKPCINFYDKVTEQRHFFNLDASNYALDFEPQFSKEII